MEEQEKSVNEAELVALAAEINAEHGQVISTVNAAVDHARHAGALLIKAKTQVGRGEWLSWLASNCPGIAVRTAQVYMRLAKKWTTLTEAQRVAPLRQVMAILAERSNDKPDDPDEMGSGGSDDNGGAEDASGGDDGGDGGETKGTRMVQLVLTLEEADEFETMVRELEVKLQTRNQSQTVLAAIRQAHALNGVVADDSCGPSN